MQFFFSSEEHVIRLSALAPAIGKVERAVGLGQVVRFRIPEEASGTIDADGALKLKVSANRGLIEFDFQPADGWKDIGGSELFITEHGMQPEGAQDRF